MVCYELLEGESSVGVGETLTAIRGLELGHQEFIFHISVISSTRFWRLVHNFNRLFSVLLLMLIV